MNLTPYIVNTVVYNQQAQVATSKLGKVNGIIFKNQGNTIAYVNDMPLYPSESFGIDGNYGEVDNTTYLLRFQSANLPAIPVTQVAVTTKVYQ